MLPGWGQAHELVVLAGEGNEGGVEELELGQVAVPMPVWSMHSNGGVTTTGVVGDGEGGCGSSDLSQGQASFEKGQHASCCAIVCGLIVFGSLCTTQHMSASALARWTKVGSLGA